MTNSPQSANSDATTDDPEDPTGRLDRYMGGSQSALDVLALLTLWIVVVPPGDIATTHAGYVVAFAVRVSLSIIYGIDMTIRARLARRHWRYVATHPIGAAAVIFPPIRVLFSIRLVGSMFRRGNLGRFMLTASILLLNGAVVVYFYERHATGANIRSLGQSLWWAVTTVSTVGYGDYYPVTVPGQIAATFIMAIAVLVLAVVTAQIASSFIDQAARRATDANPTAAVEPQVTLADLAQRLARIENLLATQPGRGPQQPQ
jgi:voltage-gated potassium channel